MSYNTKENTQLFFKRKFRTKKWTRRIFVAYVPTFSLAFFLLGLTYFSYLLFNAPDVSSVKINELEEPLSVYSQDQQLIGQFGSEKRMYMPYDRIPKKLTAAFLAAEDENFFSHSGVDISALLRAVFQWLSTGEIKTGGSTITMQLARNLFLTRKKTLSRKLSEIAIALRIEQQLPKLKILELYLNKIYLGHHTYGVAAAASTYYGKKLSQLTLAQFATLAALPKAPSVLNPVDNVKRSTERRNWILGRMLLLGYISKKEYIKAKMQPNIASIKQIAPLSNSGYVSEMVRLALLKNPKKYLGLNSITEDELYASGYQVQTTLIAPLQKRAAMSVIQGVINQERKLEYRGAEAHLTPSDSSLNPSSLSDLDYLNLLKKAYGSKQNDKSVLLKPAVVLDVKKEHLVSMLGSGEKVLIPFEHHLFAKRIKDKNGKYRYVKPETRFSRGDVIRLFFENRRFVLSQMPKIQGALISMDSHTGAILALIGGFSYHTSQFNRATQSLRQVGSAIKPFIYLAYLLDGNTAASLVSDSPLVDLSSQTPENPNNIWRPKNDSSDFLGEITLRKALYRSRNLATAHIAQELGISKVRKELRLLGAPKTLLGEDLTMSLGSGIASPLQLASMYAPFSNGGYTISPFIIKKIFDKKRRLVYTHKETKNCSSCLESQNIHPAIPREEHFIINSMLEDVIQRGTGRRARILNRKDLAGKTGTSSSGVDAWFAGYVPGLVTIDWFGYDTKDTIRGYGASTALPPWIDYMNTALRLYPEARFKQPEGVVEMPIHKGTFSIAPQGDEKSYQEFFKKGTEPQKTYQDTTKDIQTVEGIGEIQRAEDLF